MTIIWINLVVVYIFSFFSRALSSPSLTSFSTLKLNKVTAFVVIASLVTVSGLRRNIGDTYFYMYTYATQDVTNWDYILSQKDKGFNIFQAILKNISSDPQLLVFVSALITNVLIGIVLYRYSRLFELSIYVYITSGAYMVSMNGIRQYIAAAIFFAATKYLIEGNWKKYSLIVLLASSFHSSALILIPIYFMVRRKAWTATTLMLLLVAILFTFGYGQFSQAMFSALQDTHYSEYQKSTEQGANVIRVAVSAMPVILAYFGREKLRKIVPETDYIVNMSLLGVVFMIIATQNWIFARFSIYFGLYNLLLISWVVKLFADRDQKFFYYCIIVFFFIYSFYENVITLHIDYHSDYLL
jgi:transmembrane protein EpsG